MRCPAPCNLPHHLALPTSDFFVDDVTPREWLDDLILAIPAGERSIRDDWAALTEGLEASGKKLKVKYKDYSWEMCYCLKYAALGEVAPPVAAPADEGGSGDGSGADGNESGEGSSLLVSAPPVDEDEVVDARQ